MERGKEKREITVAFGDTFLYESNKHGKQRFVIVDLRENDCISTQLIGDKQDTLPLVAAGGSTNVEDIHSLVGRLTLEQIFEAYKRNPDYPKLKKFFDETLRPMLEENSKKPPLRLK